MSKIGKAPIIIPQGVTVTVNGQSVTVKGTKGELSYTMPKGISASQSENVLTIARKNDDKPVRALHGLARALVANMVIGVTDGFSKTLELVGTGYRAKLAGSKLVLSLGFSHDVEYVVPAGLTMTLEGTSIITIKGADKRLVGQTAAIIRDYKKPEPYKGKGIKYAGEVIRRKAGKAAKTAAA